MSLSAARRTTPSVVGIGIYARATEGFGPHRLAPSLHCSVRMAYQSTFDAPGKDTNAFYRRTLHVLSDARVPFLVGGSHALLNYTGIIRETKDLDLFLRRSHIDMALQALRESGY